MGIALPPISFAQVIVEPPLQPNEEPVTTTTLPPVEGNDPVPQRVTPGESTLPSTTTPPSVGGSIFDNLSLFGRSLGLPETDPRFIFTNLLRQILGLLGIILLVIILYAGFLWMLSGDNDDQRTKAKRTLIGAVIGLIIILSANSIVLFIFRTLSGATTTPPI